MIPAPRENPRLHGHEGAERGFIAALAAGRLHHAWLITGPAGVGKATLAFRLARRLLSDGPDPDNPADPVFRRIARGSHADVLSIEREWDEKRRRFKGEIGVDQVRQVAGLMHRTAAEGGYRVVVVDGAEQMNRSAANALLKVLEEPPPRAVLLLTSDAPGRLLPTVRSRCRRMALAGLDAASMAEALTHLLPEQDAAAHAGLAAVAAGSPGRAVALAEEGGLVLADLARDVLAAGRMPVPRLYEVADQVLKTDAGFGVFMALLQSGLGAQVQEAARVAGQGAYAGRPLAEWGEVWHALGRLLDETERFNLDKRTAVVAGLELLQPR